MRRLLLRGTLLPGSDLTLPPQWESGGEARGEPAGRSVATARAGASDVRIFTVALALRVAFLTLAGRYAFQADYFGFGWETGRIARALATGRGFSDPFHGLTGPTAWLAPLYPALLAAIFKLFGVYSPLSGWMALTFNSLCSASTAVLLHRTGRELFGEPTGKRAGWAWALLPYAIYWPTRIIWDTNLTACLLLLVFLLTVRLGRSPSGRLWAGFGLAWGLLALCNPAALAFGPTSWAWACLRSWRPRSSFVAPLGAALVALSCVTPWLVRNYEVFGEPVFIRGNFGAELRLGNAPGGLGTWAASLHPTQSPRELDRYRQMGELSYVAEKRREAIDAILGQPALFWTNTARRAYWFWFGMTRDDPDLPPLLRNFGYAVAFLLSLAGLGLMVRRRKPESLLFAGLFALFPVVYYITFVTTRYRHPIEPEMMLLIVYTLSTFGARGAVEGSGSGASRSPDRLQGREALAEEREGRMVDVGL
ncbi:MAG: ArnT family glycosyltransferase [Vicinamibacteria bacterium]